jgi:hypothetical protein
VAQKESMFRANSIQRHSLIPNAWQNNDDRTELFVDGW